MTSGVAVIGLTYDGFDFQRSDLDIMFAIIEGLDGLPLTRGDDPIIPFRRGRLPQNHVADRRPVVAQGWVTGHGTAPAPMYRAYLDSIKAHLDSTGSPRTLAVTLEDGTARWISAVPRNMLPGNDGMGSDFRSFSIEWDAIDPYWYGSFGVLTLDSGYVLDAGEHLDSGAEVVIAGSGSATFDTLGNVEVERLRVRILGPSTGPVGLQVGGSELIGFTVATTLAAGQELEVDNDARTALLDGVSVRNLLTFRDGNRHGEYLRLPAGPVTLWTTGGAAQTRVLFSPTWR